jgi:hypothetical protein
VKKSPFVIASALVLAAGVVVGPGSALAQRSGGAMGGGRAGVSGRGAVNGGGRVTVNGGGRGFVQPGFAHRPGFGPGFGHQHHFFRPFFPFGIVVGPAVVYAAPYDYPPSYYPPPYYDPPVYSAPMTYSPPVSYAPPPSQTISVAPAPPPPPSPNVVQFATGRYELRGDGVSTPYTWVWIPNPPTSPPPAAPTAPPAGEPGSNGANGGSGHTATRVGQLYRWTDARGVVYWTDRIDAVPEQYRSKVKSSPSS